MALIHICLVLFSKMEKGKRARKRERERERKREREKERERERERKREREIVSAQERERNLFWFTTLLNCSNRVRVCRMCLPCIIHVV